MTELLLDMPLNEEQKDFATVVLDQTHRLLRIIDDILDLSKIEAGKLELETTDFQPAAIVEAVAELMTPMAEEKDLSLTTFVAPEIPEWLRGDPGRLHQVLLNLVGNAVKFTEQGKVVVRVTLENGTDAQVITRFTVSDTGIGIPAAARQRLFEPFTQVDGSTTRKYGGTGLGLAISKRLVELMGGEIDVESKEGQGSTFWFTTLLERAWSPEVPAPTALELDPRGLRVLIVDGNPTHTGALDGYLRSWSMEADRVAGGEALQVLRKAAAANAPYDVAVVDQDMAGMSPFALQEAVHQDPVVASTRLILLSGDDDGAGSEPTAEKGFSAYVSKPVQQPQLFDALVDITRDTPRSGTTAKASDAEGTRTPRLVLLVEDNQTTQTMVLLQLQRLGYSAHTVSNGREAVAAVSVAPSAYALILMDCQMPEMDGFAATRAIREAEPASGRHIPIVAVTAYATENDRDKCLAAGMDDYISKPVTRDRLREVIEHWMPQEVQPVRVAE
jgi:polar amino acid transport system substrate-binding protein